MFQEYPIEDIIRIAIAVVVLFSGLLAIGYMIWGGFLMIISGGKEEKIKPAVNHIRHAVIGIIFLMIVLFASPIVLNLFGLTYGEYMKPRMILSTIAEISGKIFGVEVDSPGGLSDPASDRGLPNSFDNL